jgi:hypothetical protein
MTSNDHTGDVVDDEAGYTGAQAFARSILTTAVEGGINYWAYITRYRWDCPPEQVIAQGHDEQDDHALFVVDLAKIQATLDTLVDHPDQLPIAGLNDRYCVEIPTLLRSIREQLAAGTPWLDIDDADLDAGDADVIFQLTVHGAVIYG